MGKGDVDALGGLRDLVSWRMQGGAQRKRTPKEGGARGGLCHSARWRRPGTLRCQVGMNSGLKLGWGKGFKSTKKSTKGINKDPNQQKNHRKLTKSGRINNTTYFCLGTNGLPTCVLCSVPLCRPAGEGIITVVGHRSTLFTLHSSRCDDAMMRCRISKLGSDTLRLRTWTS